jgi:aminoglycoside phosphotransferase family enzyme
MIQRLVETLEKRRVAITRALETNERLAPEIYVGVVPITQDRVGRFQFGGSGDIVEWALHAPL